MFKLVNIILCLITIIILLSSSIKVAFSKKEYSTEEIIKNLRTMSIYNKYKSTSCYHLVSIKLEEIGFITVHFKHAQNHKTYCPENVLYDVKVKKNSYSSVATKIIGAKGVNGRNPDNNFWVQVSPDTGVISLSILKSLKAQTESWDFSNTIRILKERIFDLKKAEGSTPSWQKAFKNVESKLIETAQKDKTPPKIQIFSPVNNDKVDSYNLFVRGKVKDNEGVMNLIVKGNKSSVKNDGTFVSKVKLGYGTNKIKIQAEDVNGNVSEKIITVIRQEYISEQTLADIDIPPKTEMRNPDALAVVIGIENYQYVPDATYAYNDAEVFREYLSETLGFKKQRIKIATNSKATQAELNKLLGSNGWLSRNIVKGKSDLVVYFSGHGISNQTDQSTGILPFDVDPNYAIGLPLSKLYENLSKMGAKSVTVYLDACFTGQTRDSKMLIADARPIIITPKKGNFPSNINVFSASSGSQISGALKEKEHGLFTYYLLKGMSGDADTNKDKSIQLNELSKYVSKNVKDQAAINGREQTPELQGDKDRVLVQFN